MFTLPLQSIIGKVKSRVSSILPNSLSKWFSPLAKDTPQNNNESLNGSLAGAMSGNVRRRRRIELEAESDEDDEDAEQAEEDELEAEEECLDDDMILLGEYDENTPAQQRQQQAAPVVAVPLATARRGIKSSASAADLHLPPSKRSRYDFEVV